MKTRVFGLDIIRGLAIISVVFSHSGYLNITNNSILLILMHLSGVLGVEVMFVLSGFLIGIIIIKKINDGKFSLKSFYKRRWLRTLPCYYCVLFFYLIFTNISFKYLFFAQNLYTPNPDIFAVAWTLSFEEFFYLIFPLILIFALWLFKQSKKNIIRNTIISVIVISTLIRMFFALPSFGYDMSIRRIVLFRFDAIIYGVLISYLVYYYKEKMLSIKNRLFLIGLIILVLMMAIYIYAFHFWNYPIYKYFCMTLLWSFISLSLACFIPFFNNLNGTNWLITKISRTSYSTYLTHMIFIPLILNAKYILRIPIYLMATIFLTILLYNIIERPFVSLSKGESFS